MKWFLMAAAVLLAGCDDGTDAVQDQYCEMVGIWMADAKRGLAPADRAGWPDYNRNYSEVCK